MSDSEDDYEQRRLDNIKKNQALLAELDLKGAADGLGIASTSKGKGKAKDSAKRAKPVQPRRKVERKPATDAPVTRRQSTRLQHQHADPDESPAQRKARLAALELKRKREEEEREELLAQERAAKRARHHDLDLATLADEEITPTELAALQSLFGNATIKTESPGPSSKVLKPSRKSTQRDADSTNDPELTPLRRQLSPMVIRSRAKVTQERIYSMAYHPDVSKDLIFAGDKHGQLGIWDALAPPEEHDDDDGEDADTQEGGRYWRLQPHWPKSSKSSISCIRFSPTDHQKVLTSAYDCTIRSTSFETSKSTEHFSLASEGVLINSFDLTPNGNELWISDASGGLTHVDLRVGGIASRRQVNAKEKIGCVSVNQRQPHLLVSASNDRMVKVWDARRLADIPVVKTENDDEDSKRILCEAEFETVHEFINSRPGRGSILAQYEHGQSASSAYWDPGGRNILSTSYDNFLRIWNLDSWSNSSMQTVRSAFAPDHKISHNCQTGRWVTIFKAQWSPNPDVPAYFTVGNMDHKINIYAHNGEVLARLEDDKKVTAVQAVTASHPRVVARVVSGNASGRCVLWGPRE